VAAAARLPARRLACSWTRVAAWCSAAPTACCRATCGAAARPRPRRPGRKPLCPARLPLSCAAEGRSCRALVPIALAPGTWRGCPRPWPPRAWTRGAPGHSCAPLAASCRPSQPASLHPHTRGRTARRTPASPYLSPPLPLPRQAAHAGAGRVRAGVHGAARLGRRGGLGRGRLRQRPHGRVRAGRGQEGGGSREQGAGSREGEGRSVHGEGGCADARRPSPAQIRPGDAFGRQMVANLEARGCPLRSLPATPSLQAHRHRCEARPCARGGPPARARLTQRVALEGAGAALPLGAGHSVGGPHVPLAATRSPLCRLLSGGWSWADARDMDTLYTSFLPAWERRRAEGLELFDELEEWHMIQAGPRGARGAAAREGRMWVGQLLSRMWHVWRVPCGAGALLHRAGAQRPRRLAGGRGLRPAHAARAAEWTGSATGRVPARSGRCGPRQFAPPAFGRLSRAGDAREREGAHAALFVDFPSNVVGSSRKFAARFPTGSHLRWVCRVRRPRASSRQRERCCGRRVQQPRGAAHAAWVMGHVLLATQH
jgi:hypothetical protein